MNHHCDWQTCYTDIDGQIVVIRTDVAASAELEELQAPNLLRVQYMLSEPDENGLPQQREAGTIDTLRRELADWIGALGGRMVGEASGAGQHSWFFYVPCGWLEAANLVHRIGLRQNVALGAQMLPDATHRVYHEELLPTREELRRAQLAEQLAELAAAGDDLNTPRAICHEVHFDNRVQAFACADWARRNGLVVDGLLPPADEQRHYRLTFHQVMKPEAAALDAEITRISETVQRLGGRYVGWNMQARLEQTA